MRLYVYQIDLPYGVNEMVTPGSENDYTIYINSRLSDDAKKEALRHAIGHCRYDFEREDVQEIEADAHRRER